MTKRERKSKFCNDCGLPNTYHFQTWTDSVIEATLPSFLPKGFEKMVGSLVERFLSWLRIVKFEKKFDVDELPLKSYVFIQEAMKEGLGIEAQKGPYGYTGNFRLTLPTGRQAAKAGLKNGKGIFFRSLPLTNTSKINVDDKNQVKKILKKNGFPYTEGKSFWFFQKGAALRFAKKTGFPLVVKPRSGSVACHVTTDINSINELKKSIKKAGQYSSRFIVEKYMPDSWVYRATVVGNQIFCVKQVPANVIGDGASTLEQLIAEKNADPKRGISTKTDRLYHDIRHSLNPKMVPGKNEVVYLQKDPFMKLGGELEEVTEKVHPENIKLFRDIAKHFRLKLVGIDFIAKDIAVSWRDQPCAVLELNSLPCIELHHFPTKGIPKNVARALLKEMLESYK